MSIHEGFWMAGDRVRLGTSFLHYPEGTQAICWETFRHGHIEAALFVFADGGAHTFTPLEAVTLRLTPTSVFYDSQRFYRTTGFVRWWGAEDPNMLEVVVNLR